MTSSRRFSRGADGLQRRGEVRVNCPEGQEKPLWSGPALRSKAIDIVGREGTPLCQTSPHMGPSPAHAGQIPPVRTGDLQRPRGAGDAAVLFAVRQGDTNPTAHRLLQRFGSLHAVLEATEDELQTVEGVGPRSAELLHLCFALFHRYQADVAKSGAVSPINLNTYDRIGAYFVPQLCAEREEVLLAAYVDGAGRVLKCEEIARGGHARVQVDSYKIARGALMAGAAGVALAHNHPNGTPTPCAGGFSI